MRTENIEAIQKQAALRYAERYGIVSYRVQGWKMIYNVSYPAYLNNKRYTVQHTVNLKTGGSTSRVLKRYDSAGEINRR